MGKLRPINSLSKSVLSTYSVPSSVSGTEDFNKKALATCLPRYSGSYRELQGVTGLSFTANMLHKGDVTGHHPLGWSVLPGS